MTITDKLPKAPEGGVWKVRVSEYSGEPKAWIGLESHNSFRGLAILIHSPGGQVVELREEALISAAVSILKSYDLAVDEAKKRSSRLEAYRKAYADLITED